METNIHFSQVGQDKYIYETFFKNKKAPGTFLDIGAHDGITFSNTYFFEKSLNWDGICVEAIDRVFEKLIKNRSCVCENLAISDKIGTVKFRSIEGYSEMLSGIEENYNNKHIDRINKELIKHNGNSKIIEIETIDINTLLKKNNIDHIDYCTIDVEGGEEKILSVFNEKEFDITVFTVENNYRDISIRKLMKSKGYKLHSTIEFDDVYLKERKWWAI
jgi:FkbM family methyltransferase